jgi:hypothetical protein
MNSPRNDDEIDQASLDLIAKILKEDSRVQKRTRASDNDRKEENITIVHEEDDPPHAEDLAKEIESIVDVVEPDELEIDLEGISHQDILTNDDSLIASEIAENPNITGQDLGIDILDSSSGSVDIPTLAIHNNNLNDYGPGTEQTNPNPELKKRNRARIKITRPQPVFNSNEKKNEIKHIGLQDTTGELSIPRPPKKAHREKAEETLETPKPVDNPEKETLAAPMDDTTYKNDVDQKTVKPVKVKFIPIDSVGFDANRLDDMFIQMMNKDSISADAEAALLELHNSAPMNDDLDPIMKAEYNNWSELDNQTKSDNIMDSGANNGKPLLI